MDNVKQMYNNIRSIIDNSGMRSKVGIFGLVELFGMRPNITPDIIRLLLVERDDITRPFIGRLDLEQIVVLGESIFTVFLHDDNNTCVFGKWLHARLITA